MDSPFLVFDLIAGDTGLEVKGDTRNLIYTKRNYRKETVGLRQKRALTGFWG